MRVSIPLKIFIAFFSVLLLFSLMAYFVWFGMMGMRESSSQVVDLKNFQIALRGLELFNHGAEARFPQDREKRFKNAFDDLSKRTEALRRISPRLPAEIVDNLPIMEEQLAFFRRAYEELLEKQTADEGLHQRQHRLMEALALRLGDSQSKDIREDFSKILFHWGRAYHDRDINSIGALHDLLEKAKAKAPNRDTSDLLEDVELTLDKNYLNYLSLTEREDFLAGTTRRYVQVSSMALDKLLAFEEEQQSRMERQTIASILGAFALMTLLWFASNRYISRFLHQSKNIVSSIRQGEDVLETSSATDDEFGDLLEFTKDIGRNLRQTMEEVRASEEKYRTLIEEVSDWIWETDAEGRCTYTGPVGARMLGLEEARILGADLSSIICSSPDSPENLRCCSDLASGCECSGVISFAQAASGARVALESSWKPKLDKEGRFCGLRGISRNATERLALEEEKREIEAHLVQAQKMEAIGTLSGGIAHDFNNILQSVCGYADLLLLRGNLNEADRSATTRISQTAETGARLTKQLLLFSRRAGTTMEPVQLAQEVSKVNEMMERILPREIALTVEQESDLPPILADRTQVEQLLMNLIINARDAIKGRGTIAVRTRAGTATGEDGQPRRTVRLIVGDTGSGISEVNRQRIFEPFFTTKESGKGTGLGLAIVYGIVKSHGAKISLESTLGAGTTFEITFPALEGAVKNDKADAAADAQIQTPVKQLRVLIIDDERFILDTCSETFRQQGHETLTASSGEEALDLYRNNGPETFDLIVLDLSMPGIGGLECFRQMRRIRPDQAVIIASGYADGLDEADLAAEKRLVYIKKPYRLRMLLQTSRNLCG